MFIFIIAFLFLTRFCAYRNDLANIVRRRGHKQIQELRTRSSLNDDADFLSAETSLDEGLDAANGFEDPLTGQLNFFFMNGYLFCVARDDD